LLREDTTILSTFFRSFTSATRPLLLLDYDGTLAPFRVNRFEAVPWPGVRELLNQIQRQSRTRIVIITGRPASEVVQLLALDRPVEVWGLHGFEHLHTDGRRELEPISPIAREKLDELHATLHRDSFGGLFEPKPNAAVVHWRGIPSRQAALVEQRARALFEPITQLQEFRLLPFEYGIELRVGRDKGDAATLLLDECKDCGPSAFLGDDLTDEAAFSAVRDRGLSVLIRPELRQTVANLWLKPPGELRKFLECWLAASGAT
jgi:trehalose 6-phosphate phosphatase